MSKGIVTWYNGIRFRSRLEARWAAFFDRVGWLWLYEPLDLQGWIPDFGLNFVGGIVLVEVKPVFEFPQETAAKIERALAGRPNKATLIVGATLHPKPMSHAPQDQTIGWLLEGQWWSDAVVGRWEHSSYPFGFCHAEGNFADRISGCYDGGCWGSLDPDLGLLGAYWKEAGNVTQWQGE